MAGNQYLQLTGQSTPSGRIPFIRHDPADTTKKCALWLYLHGQGSRSTTHDTTSVQIIENEGGLPTFTDIANSTTHGIMPLFDDQFGNPWDMVMLAPQLYGIPGLQPTLWQDYYILQMLAYARTLPFVDQSRMYLTGYSLGGGGVWTGLLNPLITNQIAAAVPISPGYGNGSSPGTDLSLIAKCGVPIWSFVAINDFVAQEQGDEPKCMQIVRRINALDPMVSPKHWTFANGGHGIPGRVYGTGHVQWDLTDDVICNSTLNVDRTVNMNPNIYEWAYRFTKKGNFKPFYP